MSKREKDNLVNHGIPSPQKYMRARHPDLFPDSVVVSHPKITRNAFEYHLESLTSRKQEYEFEHFCRKLMEKEICPNLTIQTGPTGGGDSKVDAETYPVAEQISDRWLDGTAAGSERWAFAFSATKRWKQKLSSDVEKIISTKRGYKLIYFVTNQFISDRNCSIEEDRLARKTGINVRILDRSWIVDKVYSKDNLQIAVATLGLKDVRSENKIRQGPLDVDRLNELEELDRQIDDSSQYQNARYSLVEDCLRSAILARGLGRDRDEVDNRFSRADRLSKTLNYKPQMLRIAYNRAWTAYFWHEDFEDFDHFYNQVENLLKDSTESTHLELLVNLWMLLPQLTVRKLQTPQTAKSREKRLVKILKVIADDLNRPNNSLHARTDLILIEIMRAVHANNNKQSSDLDSKWIELMQIADDATGLARYPISRLFQQIEDISVWAGGPAFDALYTKLGQIMSDRHSEGESGTFYAKRAVQKLNQGKPYEAIRWFVQAEKPLIKDEFRTELVHMLICSSLAYERVGLLWASRNKILNAANFAWSSLEEQRDSLAVFLAFNRLAWIELKIGRIPNALTAIMMTQSIAPDLGLLEKDKTTYLEERQMQEFALGWHFLNIPVSNLSAVECLPDALEQYGLKVARFGLLYALGYEQKLRNEGSIPTDEKPESVQTFFEHWQDQIGTAELSHQPIVQPETKTLLKSNIFGIELTVSVPNNNISFGVAESILGALEVFLATCDKKDVAPHRERLGIVISTSDTLAAASDIQFSDADSSRAEIMHPTSWWLKTPAAIFTYREWLKNCIFHISTHVLIVHDVDAWRKRIDHEGSLGQVLDLSDMLTLNQSIFGDKEVCSVSDWVNATHQKYPMQRDDYWRPKKIRE